MAKKEISYNEAIGKIESLLAELEEGNVDIETLSVKLAEATSYIKVCKEKLSVASSQVDSLFKKEEE